MRGRVQLCEPVVGDKPLPGLFPGIQRGIVSPLPLDMRRSRRRARGVSRPGLGCLLPWTADTRDVLRHRVVCGELPYGERFTAPPAAARVLETDLTFRHQWFPRHQALRACWMRPPSSPRAGEPAQARRARVELEGIDLRARLVRAQVHADLLPHPCGVDVRRDRVVHGRCHRSHLLVHARSNEHPSNETV